MPSKKRIVILGSTGSIGRQALDLAAAMPQRFNIVGLAAHSNVDLLVRQTTQFQPRAVGLIQDEAARALCDRLRESTAAPARQIYRGVEGIEQLAVETEADIVLCAMVGAAGLKPALAAIRSGKDIALANKETLVAAGALVTREAKARGVRLLPVDSEHSALFQCLLGEPRDAVKRLILTASGGPFFDTPIDEMEQITVEQALAHPTWRMGNKITIDSATLMNKGLEIIEAHWLFETGVDKIDVLIHPQSIVHSLVEFMDGSVKAQMGMPDMRLPILYALFYPERVANSQVPTLDLLQSRQLTFLEPDVTRFPCLRLAKESLRIGGTMPAALNAANEVAVHQFLEGRTCFVDIPACIEQVMQQHSPIPEPSLEQILDADAWARRQASVNGQYQRKVTCFTL